MFDVPVALEEFLNRETILLLKLQLLQVLQITSGEEQVDIEPIKSKQILLLSRLCHK